jgi:predicted molibdopterin-dependent oxidoreductase YjgC
LSTRRPAPTDLAPPAAGPAQTLLVDGRPLGFTPGQSVASALLMHGVYRLRHSPAAGQPRGAFCLMGACQECAILIDGRLRQACLVPAEAGLSIELAGAPGR